MSNSKKKKSTLNITIGKAGNFNILDTILLMFSLYLFYKCEDKSKSTIHLLMAWCCPSCYIPWTLSIGHGILGYIIIHNIFYKINTIIRQL